MKNLLSLLICGVFIFFGGLACKNPLAKYTKQYNCTIANEPEPVTADDFAKRAYKHIEVDDYSGNFNQCAFDATQEALRLDPKHASALSLRGMLNYVKKDYDAALSDLSESIRLDPKNILAIRYRGLVYEETNRLDQAIEDLTTIINSDKLDLDYSKRGSLYLKKGEFEKALEDYNEAIRLDPKWRLNYQQRAEVYRKLGKNSEAEADEAKANELKNSTQNPEIVSSKDAPSSKVTDPTPNISSNSSVKSVPKTISGGVLNGKAVNLVKPPYPAAAKAVRASGAVNVQVTIDEQGNVISATAVSGHPLLRAAAVSAARQSKFSPTLLSGQPVKVTGVIVYNFAPE